MNSLQEKFQITVPDRSENGEAWTTFESARQSQECVGDYAPKHSGDVDGRKFNEMPPGMDIDQLTSEINNMPLSMAGESDVSRVGSAANFEQGFSKRAMKGTDDQYTGEHVDHFYGDAGGFVERNNYLDRE